MKNTIKYKLCKLLFPSIIQALEKEQHKYSTLCGKYNAEIKGRL